MDPPPIKMARIRPRHSLCEFEAYQCDRPRYQRSRYCDAHVCEMQTLRPMSSTQSEQTGDTSVDNKPETVVQCQYRVRRYERRCRNPVPSNSGDIHFCAEHRARVASRETNGSGNSNTGQSSGSLMSAIMSDYSELAQRWGASSRVTEPHPGLTMPRAKEERGEWKEEWDSDAESPASDDEEMMESTRNAGVYSLNELLLNAMFHRRKLMLLYQEQMAFLRRLLHHDYAVYEETRRDHRQRTATNTIIMRGRQAESFRATRNFKRYSGAESLVHEKSKRLRIRSVCPEKIRPAANPQRCAYNDPTKDEKCPERVLPLAKYCPQHIMHQANQSLFQSCRSERCEQPVLRSALAEEKESSGENDPELFCLIHRSEDSLLDVLPPDASKEAIQESISALPTLPQPPADAINAAKTACKARSLRREDSITLNEPFDLNHLIMTDDIDMKFVEEALSVFRDPNDPNVGPNNKGGGNWEDFNTMEFLPANDLWGSSELELTEVWQKLINTAPGLEERQKEDEEELTDLRSISDAVQSQGKEEEDVEIECISGFELQTLESSDLQEIERITQLQEHQLQIQHANTIESVPQTSLMGSPHPLQHPGLVGSPHSQTQSSHVGSPHPLQQSQSSYLGSPHPLQQPQSSHMSSPHPLQQSQSLGSPHPLQQPQSSHMSSPHPLQQSQPLDSPHPSQQPQTIDSPHPLHQPQSSASPHPLQQPQSSASPHPLQQPQSSGSPHPLQQPQSSGSPHPLQQPQSSGSPHPFQQPQSSHMSSPHHSQQPLYIGPHPLQEPQSSHVGSTHPIPKSSHLKSPASPQTQQTHEGSPHTLQHPSEMDSYQLQVDDVETNGLQLQEALIQSYAQQIIDRDFQVKSEEPSCSHQYSADDVKETLKTVQRILEESGDVTFQHQSSTKPCVQDSEKQTQDVKQEEDQDLCNPDSPPIQVSVVRRPSITCTSNIVPRTSREVGKDQFSEDMTEVKQEIDTERKDSS